MALEPVKKKKPAYGVRKKRGELPTQQEAAPSDGPEPITDQERVKAPDTPEEATKKESKVFDARPEGRRRPKNFHLKVRMLSVVISIFSDFKLN